MRAARESSQNPIFRRICGLAMMPPEHRREPVACGFPRALIRLSVRVQRVDATGVQATSWVSCSINLNYRLDGVERSVGDPSN
jgi:hypothetical protein